MNGIVSGRARLAAAVDSSGKQVDVLLYGDSSSWRRMHIWELLRLLGDIDDLQTIADATRERLAVELERAVRAEQSLWLWLILLDRHRSVHIRDEAAAVLDKWLLHREDLREPLLKGTLQRPLPADSDITGAFWACERRQAHGPWDLLRDVEALQPHAMQIVPYALTAAEVPYSVPWPRSRDLFDGTYESFKKWIREGRGTFTFLDGVIVAVPRGDLGLLYLPEIFDPYAFKLEIQFLQPSREVAFGVFVQFNDPRLPVPMRGQPGVFHLYMNKAWVPVHTGIGFHIDQGITAVGADEEKPPSSFYFEGSAGVNWPPPLTPGQWHRLVIRVIQNRYSIELNGVAGPSFVNRDPYRGHPPHLPSSFIGLQAIRGNVACRSVRIS